jgi:hypothetical protein
MHQKKDSAVGSLCRKPNDCWGEGREGERKGGEGGRESAVGSLCREPNDCKKPLLLLVFFVSWLGYDRKHIYSGSTLHVRVMCCGLPFTFC